MIETIRNEVATEGLIRMCWQAFVDGDHKALKVYQICKFHFPFAS